MSFLNSFLRVLAAVLATVLMASTADAAQTADYKLSAGDSIRIQVFQNQDLTLETKVSESGTVTYPLIGEVHVGGGSTFQAEQQIARRLDEGGFVKKPQVTVVLLQNFGNQVSVLGQVNHPGRFPLESYSVRLTEVIALAGGIAQSGADVAIVSGTREGKPFTRDIDIAAIFLDGATSKDLTLAGGDVVYVHRAPMFYIYGEAQRPGSYRVERDMTLQQALATGGGPTARGTDKRLRVTRHTANGMQQIDASVLTDPVLPDDVIYVRESLF